MIVTERHKTALHRGDLSRPIQCLLRDGLLSRERTFLDYGCGRGDDFRRLSDMKFECRAWDPVHRADGEIKPSDVVNLGYVVNVIENPAERGDTLRRAWSLAKTVLVVSARLTHEAAGTTAVSFQDGVLTTRGTFQKFYEQQELRSWVEDELDAKAIPAGPGIVYVFRDSRERESFSASRWRARHIAPRVLRSEAVFEANRELLDPLIQFVSDRGRLPAESELEVVSEITTRLGSLNRAFSLVQRLTSTEEWDRVREERSQEVLLYLALERFGGRPKASELPLDLRLDIKAFFRSYKSACEKADDLLFSMGNMENISNACKEAPFGKNVGGCLYVHRSAVDQLPPTLRAYEGCARAYLGEIEEANVVRLGYQEPKIAYLSYPDFDRDPHPVLEQSLAIHLQTFRIRETDYKQRENPPILHRKETFLPESDVRRAKFARLTAIEEKWGLYEEANRIGTRSGWEAVLAQRGVELRGHRVVRSAHAEDLEEKREA